MLIRLPYARRFDAIEAKLDILIKQGANIMAAMDDLQASVTAEDTVIDSAMALITGLSAQLAAAGTNPAALSALKATIDAKAGALAAAVAANTPAAATASSAPAAAS